MAFVVKDRVRETTLTTGTGTITLAGAVIGYQTFSAIGDGNNTFYTIAGQATSEWEVGIGTYTASGTTLSRDTILASSNSGSAVNFSAGTKDVFVTYPAGKAIFQNNLDSVVVAANTSSDALRITQTGSGNALLVEDSANPDATPFVVDANGIVISGNTAAVSAYGFNNQFQVLGTSNSYQLNAAFRNDAFSPFLTLAHSRNTSIGGHTVLQNGDDTGTLAFAGSDGTQFIRTAQIYSAVDGTPGTNDMPGRLIFSTTADGASSPTERMRIDSAGNVGIGGAAAAYARLQVTGTLPSSSNASYGISSSGTIPSTTTSSYVGFDSAPSTAVGSFTLTNLNHFIAYQGTIGAGSTVTNQYGFNVSSTLTGATNNYGFYSDIASGTGRWNFFAAGTAQNYFAGNVLIGSTSATPSGKLTVLANRASISYNTVFSTYNGASFENDFYIGFNGTVTNVGNYQSFPIAFVTNNTERMRITSAGNVLVGRTYTGNEKIGIGGPTSTYSTATSASSIFDDTTVSSAQTNAFTSFSTYISTQAASFTLANLTHYKASQFTIGAGSIVTNQYGFFVDSSLTGATNNYGFYSSIASGTGRWNFYANGTASNFFGGNTIISVADNTNAALRITQTGTGNALVVEDSANPDSSPFVVNADGRVLSGLTTPITTLFGNIPGVQINAQFGVQAMALSRFSADQFGADIDFVKSRNATVGSQTVLVSGDQIANLNFAGSDGTQFVNAASISANVDGTPGTNDMPGRLVFSTTADGASSPTERMRIDSAGRVGIGGAAAAYARLQVTGTLPSSSNASYGISSNGTVPATSTLSYIGFDSAPSTAVGSFTLTSLIHFFAYQGTIGAGSTVTNQYGFASGSNLTGATNNYGFYSDIASGTGRWNFYAGGTADNYFAGSVGIGGAPIAGFKVSNYGNLSGATTAYSYYSGSTFQSGVTTNGIGFGTFLGTQAASFTLTSLTHFRTAQGTFGAGSAVTNQFGFEATNTLTGATNNFGFYSNIASGTGRWNFYAAGTAQNSFAGNVLIGSTSATPSGKLTVLADRASIAYNTVFSTYNGASFENDFYIGFNGTVTNVGNYQSFPIAFITNNTERMRIDNAGNVGIGGSSYAGVTLRAVKSITGSTFSTGILSDGTVQSDVTGGAYYFQAATTTAASAFTTTTIAGFLARQNTIGAGSTVTGQYGFFADSTLTGATSNYGFFSNIASGTGRWNFYANGTAQNYFEGLVGLKTIANNGGYLEIGGTANVVSNSGYGVTQYQTIPSTATSQYWLNTTVCSTAAASFTLSDLRHYNAGQGTFGAGSTVTSQYGFFAQSNLTGATNNYGFYSNIASGTGRWNFYANGTAQNYFAGTTLIGTTTNTNTSTLVVNGTISQTVSGTQYLVVDQSDIGTGANEIPLNQYLGANAYVDTETPALNVGTGITTGTGTICKANGGLSGGIYRMTILIDLTGLNSGGTAGDIIGVNGTALPCYIAQLPAMTVLGGRMTCLETPAGGDTDIDLYSATEGTGVEDQAITALTETQIINAGAQTIGTVTYFAADPATNAYFYLVGQGTANATYTAGRFLIEIFGVQ